MRWLFGEVERHLRAELPVELSSDLLRSMHQQAASRWRRDGAFRWWLIILAPTGFISVWMADQVAMVWMGDWRCIGRYFISMLVIIVAVMTFHAMLRPRYWRHWRAVVREHGLEVCAGCGYLLHSLGPSIHSCPECGAPRQPMPPADQRGGP
jgi:hypothetical protein